LSLVINCRFTGFFVCKLKKLSNDKKSLRGQNEQDDAESAEEEGEEEDEDSDGPPWAQAGGIKAPARRVKNNKGGSVPPPSDFSKVPVSRPKLNPKANRQKQQQQGSGRGPREPVAAPVDLGNPGPDDVVDVPVKKKAEPSIVRAAKKVSPECILLRL